MVSLAGVDQESLIFNKLLHQRLMVRNQNVISAQTGPTGCLCEDTIVSGQTRTLGDLYLSGNKIIDTISIVQPENKKGRGCYYPKKSKSEIIDSGIKEIYEIELEDGKKVFATSEHKFFKRLGHNEIGEETVDKLKIGDKISSYPENFYNDYLDNARIKEQTRRDLKYNPRSLCKKCNALFYQEKRGGGNVKAICKNCSKKKIKIKEGNWFEWEDNILRQFYYSFTKTKLMELLPLRKSWKGIMHRAMRINLKRNSDFQWKQNAWTSKNNPVHDPKLFAKMMNKQAHIFKRNEMTSIEKKVADFLRENNIKYEFNKVVRTKTSFRFPDFQIGNLIIECDGIYWHKGREKEDMERENELKACGFEIIRFTDLQINNEWGKVKECIAQKLNQ